MPGNRWMGDVESWTRVRFGVFTCLAFLACLLLLIAVGLAAAIHLHVVQALLGAACLVLIALWFRVAERWSHRRHR